MRIRETPTDTRGETRVHATAIVDADAELGEGVTVGPLIARKKAPISSTYSRTV